MDELQHVPVLIDDVVELLQPRPGLVFVDGTVGGGGHASLLLERLLPGGRLIGLDKDGQALERARCRLAPYGDAVTLVREDFRRLGDALRRLDVTAVDGVLLDVGVSSFQLDDGERGFSYHYDAPLDMRMDDRHPVTAAELVNTMPHPELARILRTYGEEPYALRI